MNLITCKKSRGGGNSLKFRVKSEEVRVGGSSWRLGGLSSFILSIVFAFGMSGAWAGAIYNQVVGMNDKDWTCVYSNDGLSFDEEITTTPKLAFRGITLDDIPVGASFFSKFWGSWSSWKSIDNAVTAVGFCEQRCDSDKDGKTDKIALQVCVYDGQVKGVVIVLTNGQNGDGVYVQRYGRVGVSNSSVFTTAQFTLNADGTMSKTGNVTTGDDTNYRLQGLRIHGMSPVDTESRLAFRGVTLDDIKDYSFMSGYHFGTWMTKSSVSNTATEVSTWYDSNDADKLKKVVMQFMTSDKQAAVIALTNGVDGVYAQQVLGVSGSTEKVFAIGNDGSVTRNKGTDQGANKYGIHDFFIYPMPCVAKEPIKVFTDPSKKLTLDDIVYGKFTARMCGLWVNQTFRSTPDSAIGYNKKVYRDEESGEVTQIIVEFQVRDGGNTKCLVVSFENGDDGVYAKAINARYSTEPIGYEFRENNGTLHGDVNNEKSGEVFAETTMTAPGYGVCDLRVTMPTVHEWTLEGSKRWSELRNDITLSESDVVKILVKNSDAKLIVDENVKISEINFVGIAGGTLQIQGECALTTENIRGVGNIINYGTLNKVGKGTVCLPFNNASTGITTVSAGTLKVSSQTGSGKEHIVRVKDGAAFDLNGVWATVSVVLEGGANLANSYIDAAWGSSINIPSLTLEGNATVTATHTFGLRTTGHGANTLNLGTYTLTVNAASGKSFFVDNTTINGTGKILVASGTLFSYSDSRGDAYTLEVGKNGKLAGGANGITCGNFVNHGLIDSSNNKVIVKGTLTPGNSLIYLKLADGAKIKASVIQAQTVSTTFSASGTITVDASEIDKQTLKVTGKMA